MIQNLILVGIGGTGAKIVEAVIHLASSGNAPINIYPVLIDQDRENGNVDRCKKVIDLYDTIQKKFGGVENKWLFKSKLLKKNDNLLPLVPENSNWNFASAIKFSQMTTTEQKIIKSLYSDIQLDEILKHGYKKRAHMGAPLMEKLLISESYKSDTDTGLNMIVSDTSGYENVHVYIVGSIFGGTGASGITNVGKFFKVKMPHAIINSIMLTPYFIVSDKTDDNDMDKGLVRSDTDMQLVKVALEMYKDDIQETFDRVFIIGSQKESISKDIVTQKSYSGGPKQKNPSHIFELIAASFTNIGLNVKPRETIFVSYVVTTESQNFLPYKFIDIPEMNIDGNNIINKEKVYLLRAFAYLLSHTQDAKNSWKKRQPWIPIEDEEYRTLLDWAKRHNQFWMEQSRNRIDGRAWETFYYDDKIKYDIFKLASKLSIYLNKNQSLSIFDTLETLNRLYKL